MQLNYRIRLNLFHLSRSGLLALIVGLFVLQHLPADEQIQFHWPQIRGKLPELKGITSTFGESRGDHFHSGLDIASFKQPVYAPAAGQVLYVHDRSRDPFGVQPGPGNFVLLDHGKGWWSGYFHLNSVENFPSSLSLKEGDKIGESGNSGHSYGSHLHFFFAKDNGSTYVNPLQVLPAVEDKNAPAIGDIKIHTNPDSYTRIRSSETSTVRLTRPYPVTVSITDPGLEKNTRRGVYKLRWSLNGGAKQELVFDTLKQTPSGWRLSGSYGFERIFLNQDYLLGEIEFVQGENRIWIEVEDHKGNRSSQEFEMNVNREY